MSKEHIHDELHKLVFDLNHHTILQSEDGLDGVWQKIIKDVCDYETRMSNPWYPEYASPQDYSLEQSDRPDIIYECDDYIMGIECFEFDASKKTRKGSKQKQKEQEADRAIREEYQQSTVPKDSFLSIERLVDVELSAKNYYESLLSNFKIHADSIDEYRHNLSKKATGKRNLLTFFIKDVTAIGNYVEEGGKAEALNPLKLPLILGLLASTPGLDYVIFRTTDSYVPFLRIQAVSLPLMKALRKKCYGADAKFVPYQYKRQSHFWG